MIASEPSPSFLAFVVASRSACPPPRFTARVAALCLLGLSACQSGEVGKSAASSAGAPAAPAKPAANAPVAAAKAPPLPGALPAPEDVAAPPATATKTPSGLAYVVLQPGTGPDHPIPTDEVRVHYTGWTKDGNMFDSSLARKPPTPAKFGVTQVIKGWTEGLQLMTVGEKVRFWIPGELAYGDPPKRPGAPAGQLTFDVELLEIIKPLPPPPPPEVPKDVAAAPASAKKTASGLRYRVLTPGKGKDHPKADSQVRVHYSGWTPDGKMFDSSVTRGEPLSFGLNRVIKGWTEGVQLMVVGEKTRFWIPAELAYGKTPERAGAPAGPLVFDVELLGIQ
ncbi:MAG: FKBP-type peptidyl-prolyl cis-trans isomerase [Deltaproteobacteria bacterium]